MSHSSISNQPSTLQHAAAQNTIPALEFKVASLETLVKSQAASIAPPQPPEPELTSLSSESQSNPVQLEKKSINGGWLTLREEWASERERLAFAREEWDNKANSIETNLGSTAANFESRLVSLAVLERQ